MDVTYLRFILTFFLGMCAQRVVAFVFQYTGLFARNIMTVSLAASLGAVIAVILLLLHNWGVAPVSRRTRVIFSYVFTVTLSVSTWRIFVTVVGGVVFLPNALAAFVTIWVVSALGLFLIVTYREDNAACD